MNVLVVSDSHGKVDKLIQAVEQVHPGYVLHLGDCQRDLEKLRQAFPMLPMEGVPASVTPRCSGQSKTSAAIR